MRKIRTVLCYGDSNTYGAVPNVLRKGFRFPQEQRWTGVMAKQLGPGWRVIEEGLPGRTTVHADPIEGAHKNGIAFLPVCLESHAPIDLVVIMLGTNDLKARFAVQARDIADSIEALISCVQGSINGPDRRSPKVLVVTPAAYVDVGVTFGAFEGAVEKTAELGKFIQAACEFRRVAHFDAGSVVETSVVDGIHLDLDAHKALGVTLAGQVAHLMIE